uniref:Lipase n=1 Tax=Panagrolaimus sp. ES5 TaxID=591445 RepID=A0AC34FVY1_9BILA
MKFYTPLVFALLFIVAECFYVPEEWLTKHGYNLKKNSTSSRRRLNGKNRMNQKSSGGDIIPVGPFTEDFTQWLETAGYADYDFPSLHLGINASYGGKEFKEQELKHNPVIFIHGNSDGALDDGTEFSSGFSATIKYFLSKGYTPAELYAVTWGDRKLDKSFTRMHTCATMKRLRKFVEAVIEYTKAEKVDIISHSMGVTLARQIIKGGAAIDTTEICELGKTIKDSIRNFLGIAAANYGLCMCDGKNALKLPVCGVQVGFYSGGTCKKYEASPGVTCASARKEDKCEPSYSHILMGMNGDMPAIFGPMIREAENIFSFWSEEDEIVGPNSVWGRKTSFIPLSNGFKIFANMKHHQLKTDTVADQYKVIVDGTLY